MKRQVLDLVFSRVKFGGFEVAYWDGQTIRYGGDEAKFKLIFRKEPVFEAAAIKDPVLFLGEAYMDGLLDYEGRLEDILLLMEKNQDVFFTSGLGGKVVAAINSMADKLTQKKNIQHHYDLGNDFFSLWLDDTMSYSCAYFEQASDSLKEAQLKKIEHVLKKLNLKPGQRLLDIGSGWGWLILKAARKYGVKATGITLSEEQFRKTQQRIAEYGLSDRVEVRLMNYLDLDSQKESFDAICSIGMFEHVGKEHLPQYMEKVSQLLAPGGVSVLHSIMGIREDPPNTWIKKYIFPGGYVPSLRETINLLPEYELHLTHAESLRMHYAMTLDRWYENFTQCLDQVRHKFDERFIRMWSLYLQGCAASFRVSGLDIYQLVFTKGLNNQLPLTWKYLYDQ